MFGGASQPFFQLSQKGADEHEAPNRIAVRCIEIEAADGMPASGAIISLRDTNRTFDAAVEQQLARDEERAENEKA